MLLRSWLWALPVCCAVSFAGVPAQNPHADGVQDPDQASPLGLGETTGFGHALAEVTGHVLIGAPRSYRWGERGGALWSWSQSAQRLSPISVPGNRDWSSLGWAMAVRTGNPALAVAAPGEEVQSVPSGAVHLVQEAVGGFHWVQRLEPDTPESHAGFGHALQWSGEDLWVAAPFASGPLGLQAGCLTCFSPGPLGYNAVAQWTSPSPQAGARFGEALALTDQEVIVGAPGQQGGGAVFVIPLPGSTASGPQVLKVHPSGVAHDGFGSSLAVNADRTALAVGAPWSDGGAVYTYRRGSSGLWKFQRTLTPPAESEARGFGRQVCFEGDSLWISAPGEDGHVYCLADWRSKLAPLLFAVGGKEEALGSALLLAGKSTYLGAPGHGHATFEPAVPASVYLEGKPSLQFTELGAGVSVQTVVHGAPSDGLLSLGVGGLRPRKSVELRLWDSTGAGHWRTLGAGSADPAGAWEWSGTLPKPASGAWKLALHSCNTPPFLLRVRQPDGR
jgi:hypothetical protein